MVQLGEGGAVAAGDPLAQFPGRAGVQDAAGVVAHAVRGGEIECGQRPQAKDRSEEHGQGDVHGAHVEEQSHGDGGPGADQDHATHSCPDSRRALHDGQFGAG
jgi:hypothetical protein